MLFSAAFGAVVLVTASVRAAPRPYAFAPPELNSVDFAWPGTAGVIESDYALPPNATDDEWLVGRAHVDPELELVPDSFVIPAELEARDLAYVDIDPRAFQVATVELAHANPKFRSGKTRTLPPATPVARPTTTAASSVKATLTGKSSAPSATAAPAKATVTDQATLAQYADWTKRYVRTATQGKYVFYNGDGSNGDAATVSEAHGYGMLITAMLGDQSSFDDMLKFFINYRDPNGMQRIKTGQLYMTADGKDSATDGDVDIASSLFLAARIWPAGSSAYPAGKYLEWAVSVANALRKKVVHRTANVLLLGDWADPSDRTLYDATRSSDMILSAMNQFATQHPDATERAAWASIITSTIEAAGQMVGATGLLPDFAQLKNGKWVPAKPNLLEDTTDGQFAYNSCRTPWRLGHYYAITQDDRIKPMLDLALKSLTTSATKAGAKYPQVPAGIDIATGAPLADYSDRAFIAPAAYLASVLGQSSVASKGFAASASAGKSYFGDSIAMVIAAQMATPASLWR